MAAEPGPEAEAASLERLRAELTRPPFNRWLGAEAVAADPRAQTVTVALALRAEMTHDAAGRLAHGGIVAALIDMTGYAAVALWHDRPTPTVVLQVDYLAPAAGPVLRAEGRLRRRGRSIGRADVEVFSGDRLVALGRGSFSTGGPAG